LKRYEGMFLFDSAMARDWAAIEQEVRRLCGRIGAELLVCVKFDERKLAYEIKRRKRGTYVLTYFETPSERLADLERDARLSELVLRLLVLKADQVSDERINELKAWPAETPLQPLSSDRRHDEGERFGRGGDWAPRGERGARPVVGPVERAPAQALPAEREAAPEDVAAEAVPDVEPA